MYQLLHSCTESCVVRCSCALFLLNLMEYSLSPLSVGYFCNATILTMLMDFRRLFGECSLLCDRHTSFIHLKWASFHSTSRLYQSAPSTTLNSSTISCNISNWVDMGGTDPPFWFKQCLKLGAQLCLSITCCSLSPQFSRTNSWDPVLRFILRVLFLFSPSPHPLVVRIKGAITNSMR